MLRRFFFFLVRCLTSLRYRVHLETNTPLTSLKGCLLLPNHPGYTDPILVMSQLWPWFKPGPLAFESYYRHPLIYPFMVVVNALEVPDLESASHKAKEKVKENLQCLINSLENGNNHIIWPSGHLQKAGKEDLGSASAVYEVLQQRPNLALILVRTSGLWGSRFTISFHGRYPSLFWELLKSFFFLIVNLIFFMPRRKIVIEIKKIQANEIPYQEKQGLNRYLESWYNAKGEESPLFRPYHFLFFWRKRPFPVMEKPVVSQDEKIDKKLQTEIQAILDEHLTAKVSLAEYSSATELSSMGMDSISRMEVLLAMEQRFGFTAPTVPETLGEIYSLCAGTIVRETKLKIPPEWKKPVKPQQPGFHGETVLECFLNRVNFSGPQVAMVDDIAGVITYRQMLTRVLVVAKQIPKDDCGYIAILLPAGAASMISYFAVLLAGKIPVFLNWTTGPANLQHAVELLKLKTILTAQRFLDRTGIQIDNVSWFFLEDIGKRTTLLCKLACAWKALNPLGCLSKNGIEIDPSQVAAVLFTSGSEKAPKAVPLTNGNILSNQKNGVPVLGLKQEDSFLAFLPPFHSFGLCITGILPLLMGMRVVFHPDPTDAHTLLEKLEKFEITLLAGTPTFISHIIDRAKNKKLEKVRLFIIGAEKCPESLFAKGRECAPNALILEGYGITECSPVVAANTPGNIKAGSVGRPLPGIQVQVVNPDSHQPLKSNELGMLYVSGPTIFPGYLGKDAPDPFIELEGKRWYKTGDLVIQDSDGFIFFKGRLKRFMKVGGEMVSLPALEEPFTHRYPPDESGPVVAIEGFQTDTIRCIALFTRVPMQVHEANQILQKAGFRGVCRIDRVFLMETIPILGTGKTNYRELQESLKKEMC